MKHVLPTLLIALLLAGCTSAPAPAASSPPPPSPPQEEVEVLAPVSLPEPEPEPDPRQEAIDDLIASMPMEWKVGQLFFAQCSGNDPEGKIEAQYFLGGYLLFDWNFKDKTAQQIKDQISVYQSAACTPMLIGVDEEGGAVVRVSSNSQLRDKRFTSPQKLYRQGGLEAILSDCREKDELLSSLGINVNFAPVADLSTDPNDFIYHRTLGQGAEETSEYVAAVVAQMETDGMGSVLKHFPGYGSNKDTHTGSAVDERSLDAFRTGDFLPFRAGIEAGNTAVLVSHNIIQQLDPDRPASLSPAVYRLLREELDFDGPALTDDLTMRAITQYAKEQNQSPAVLALAAGCDMVVIADFQTQIPQVLAALEDGSLPRERVDEALSRVLGWKYDLGLIS